MLKTPNTNLIWEFNFYILNEAAATLNTVENEIWQKFNVTGKQHIKEAQVTTAMTQKRRTRIQIVSYMS